MKRLNENIIRRLVVDLGIDGDVIKIVMDDALYRAIGAMRDNNSVEISGWGRLHFNRKRAIWTMNKLIRLIGLYTGLPSDISDVRRKSVYDRACNSVESGNILIEKLKDEIELVRDFRRVEEQFNSSKPPEGENK
jgi:hypothetical protein